MRALQSTLKSKAEEKTNTCFQKGDIEILVDNTQEIGKTSVVYL